MLIKFGEGWINKDYIAHVFKFDGDIVNAKTGGQEYNICVVSSIDGWTRFGEKFESIEKRDIRFDELIHELRNS
jgi:hypothetical protein